MITKVRSLDRMVFEVDPETLEPKEVSTYDAYCFEDPEPGVTYISEAEWNKRRDQERTSRSMFVQRI